MPNTNLGKVKVTPKGDYNSGTQYEILDIVSFGGGSYIALKDVLGIEPANDGVNWQQIAGQGTAGNDGVTFTPSVSAEGIISWTNDGDEENPEPVNIKGPKGDQGNAGKPAIIQNGTWWQWDEDEQDYVDTGESANGNVLYATFDVDPSTGKLTMYTPEDYDGPTFAIVDGILEVTVNG